jgi:aminoglycoside/choline kinase family phosphotransferase
MDQRLQSLIDWASTEIRRDADMALDARVEMVSGDASFRRYYRMTFRDRSWVLVDAPPEKEDNPRFIRIAEQWRAAKVAVPEVLASDTEQGFMLLEDFGDRLFWQAVHEPTCQPGDIEGCYRQAIDQLIHIQTMDSSALPAYDEALLTSEMQLFRDWLCEQQLQIALSDDERQMFDQATGQLVKVALSQAVVPVHRDYHSRNLMVRDAGELGIIDFQDAVAGPIAYDLVSLLRDCYVRWDSAMVDELLAYYWKEARRQGVYRGEWSDLVREFDWMGMQRHLKAAGIFARLNLRDGKSGYLDDIPNTCQYLVDVSAKYPELSELHQWLLGVVQPALDERLA